MSVFHAENQHCTLMMKKIKTILHPLALISPGILHCLISSTMKTKVHSMIIQFSNNSNMQFVTTQMLF